MSEGIRERGEPMRKAKPKPRPIAKQAKVQLRLRPEQKDVLTRAAKLRQTTLSSFLLENAYTAAQHVLAEQVHFTLPPERWQAFRRALDAPPRPIPALQKLFREARRFDGPRNAP
jgi:uncharacterized protein (DUF1778 family)